MWTQFWDMNSGGGTKEKWDKIYIEASMKEAKIIFYNRFGHNPERVSCTCCGKDYSIDSHESLAQLTGYHRGCRSATKNAGNDYEYRYFEADEKVPEEYEVSKFASWGEYQALDAYLDSEGVCVISKDEIWPEERLGSLPRQGYVWVD